MKKRASILSATAIVAFVAVANAGVVVEEQQTISQANTKVTHTRTVMIQGDKQKSIFDNGNRAVITDLGKGTMMMVDATRKTYVELPFPPKGGGAAAVQGGIAPTISFKKTGRGSIMGYSCDEYSGAGMVGGNSVSLSGCFSESAPGATEYGNFQREMASKAKDTAMANIAQIPHGVPLKLTITTTIGTLVAPRLPPEQVNKLNQAWAHRQFITDTSVSKITTTSLPADSFQIPSGYQKQQPRQTLSGVGRGTKPAQPPRSAPQ